MTVIFISGFLSYMCTYCMFFVISKISYRLVMHRNGYLLSNWMCFMLQDLKLKFYQLMIEVARHDGSYLDICKYYRAMFDTPSVLEDKDKKHEVRENLVSEHWLLVCNPFTGRSDQYEFLLAIPWHCQAAGDANKEKNQLEVAVFFKFSELRVTL